MERWFSLKDRFRPSLPPSPLAAVRHSLEPAFACQLVLCSWERAGEPSSDNGAPHLRTNPVGHGVVRGGKGAVGRESVTSVQKCSVPFAPTLNPVPNLISFRVTRSAGHKRLTGRCSELSGGVAFSDHTINFRQPVR